MKRIKFIEVNYYCHTGYDDPADVIAKHLPTDLFLQELKATTDLLLVKHMNYDGSCTRQGIMYRFFRRKNSFWQIPRLAHRCIKQEQPDIIVVQGLIFPLQVIALRRMVGKKAVILLQHQGEVPYRRKRIFQKIADRCVDGYLFTSLANADEWINAGVIKNKDRCFEMPPATTAFVKQEKAAALQKTGMNGAINFLWVGRLNANKDPLTVLHGFEKYIAANPLAKLYMIYTEDDMLDEVRGRINSSDLLSTNVQLVGQVPHAGLEAWYSAADYIISGSHREGGSYALMEAMACGCVPVVTTIPASMKMIGEGSASFYFQPGNAADLCRVLMSLMKEEYAEWSLKARAQFDKEMSAGAIARKMMAVYDHLKIKQGHDTLHTVTHGKGQG